MDPISAVSFASSVVQLVHFSLATVKTVHDVWQTGSSAGIANSKEIGAKLASFSSAVETGLQSSQARAHALTQEEKDLVDVGTKCRSIAERLGTELAKIEVQDLGSRKRKMSVAFKTVLNKGKIERIKIELEEMQKVLETGLLVTLKCVKMPLLFRYSFTLTEVYRQKIDTESLQCEQGFASLSSDQQTITTNLAESQTKLESLVATSTERTIEAVNESATNVTKTLQDYHTRKKFYNQVKESLFFPEINAREEHIEQEFDGFEDSNTWVFSDHLKPDLDRKWDNFPEWLRSGSGIYWINGVPGSGKSTLMSFINSHQKKRSCYVLGRVTGNW